MAAILNDLGEEWLVKHNADGVTLDVGLYDDSTDAISDPDDLGAITTEPTSGNYARQTGESFSASDIDGDWGFENDNQISYDVTNTTETVDSYFIVANFQAEDTNDSAAEDHLIATGALSQSRDLSQIDTLNISAGGTGVKVD